jgi:ADP-ribose pyrophosphatase YjhB (NUDIX family)
MAATKSLSTEAWGSTVPRVSATAIVMAVLRCGQKICLARRSLLVGTSRGLWSVVTGYLEPETDPLTQAWTELDEELGLRPPGVQLVGRLDPMQLSSPSSGKEFVVHPFLFECDANEPLVLNWEHDEAQWAELSRLEAPDCVAWQLPLVQALLESHDDAIISAKPGWTAI